MEGWGEERETSIMGVCLCVVCCVYEMCMYGVCYV